MYSYTSSTFCHFGVLQIFLTSSCPHVLIYMASKLHSSDFRIGLIYFFGIFLGLWGRCAPEIFFTQQPEDVFGVKEGEIYLNCTASATLGGPVNITWWQEGQLVNDARHYVLPDGRLYISGLIHKPVRGRSDEGTFTCLASNQLGAITSHSASLSIAYLARLTGEPQDVAVSPGALARFSCDVQGVPTPNITWEKDKQPLPQNNQKYTVLNSGVLQIQHVSAADEGSYRCRASNLARVRHSKIAHLSLLPPESSSSGNVPTLLSGPQDTVALQGEDVLFECAISHLPQPPSSGQPPLPQIIWSRADGEPLPEGRFAIIGKGNLQLSAVAPTDTGSYVCMTADSSVVASASLTVNVPPRVTVVDNVIEKPSAYTIRVQCQAEGIPQPLITWYKNGRLIVFDGRTKVKDDGGTLLIANSVESDTGLYQCMGTNSAGQHLATASISILVSDEAPVKPSGLEAVGIASRTIDLRWDASPLQNGIPTMGYSVHYFRSDGVGEHLQNVVQGELRLRVPDLIPYTNYTIFLVAYNPMGASRSSESITVCTRPGVPVAAPQTEVSANGATTLGVTWSQMSPAEARGPIVGYKVFHRKSITQAETYVVLPPSVHRYTITGLESGERYDVRVLAATEKGYPDLPEETWPWVSQITNPNRHAGIPEPTSMRASAINATTLMVSWDRSEVLGGQGPGLLGYQLSLQKEPDPQPRIIILTEGDTSHTIFGLEPDTVYTLAILAFNTQGEGDPTSITYRTPPSGDVGLRPPPPVDIVVEACNDTAIHISWNPPVYTTASISGYKLRYSIISHASSAPDNESFTEISTTGQEVTVGNLLPYTFYEFAVLSKTFQYEGRFSRTVGCRTQQGMPSAPLNPRWSLHGPGAVQLEWQPPAQKNGVIVAYHILFRENIHVADGWQTKEENGTVTKALVANLESNALYFFKLKAVTGKGEGPPTHILEVQTQTVYQPNPPDSSVTPGMVDARRDKELGIIVGVCSGLGCIIICIIIMVVRSRCPLGCRGPTQLPPTCQHHQQAMPCSCFQPPNSMIFNMNRQPYYQTELADQTPLGRSHEIDSFMPMLTSMRENEHSDTKGHGGTLCQNGRLNGYGPLNGMRVTKMSNGRLKTYYLRSDQEVPVEDSSQVPLQAINGINGSVEEGQNVSTCSGYSSAGPAACSLEDLDQCVGDVRERGEGRLQLAHLGSSSMEGEDSGHCCADHTGEGGSESSSSRCCSGASSLGRRQRSASQELHNQPRSSLAVHATQPTPLPSKHPTQPRCLSNGEYGKQQQSTSSPGATTGELIDASELRLDLAAAEASCDSKPSSLRPCEPDSIVMVSQPFTSNDHLSPSSSSFPSSHAASNTTHV